VSWLSTSLAARRLSWAFPRSLERSDDGGREELDESWLSRASNSRMGACRTAFAARSVAFSSRSTANCSSRAIELGAGVVGDGSGASGSSVAIMRWL
jgi:hypothetical protein